MFEYLRFIALQVISKGGKYFFEIAPASIMLASDYGDYVYLISILILVSSLITAGLPNSLLRLVPEWDKNHPKKNIAPVLWDIQLITFTFSITLVLFFLRDKFDSSLLFYFSIFVLFYSLIQSYTTLFRAKGQIKKWAFYRDVLFQLLVFMILLPIILFSNQKDVSLKLVIGILVLLSFISISVIIYKLHAYYENIFYIRLPFRADTLEVFKVSAPMLFTGLAYLLLARIDILMLEKYIDGEMLGGYNIVVRTTLQVVFFWQVLSAYYMPKLAHKFVDEDIHSIIKLHRKYLIHSISSTLFLSGLFLLAANTVSLNKYIPHWGVELHSSMLVILLGQLIAVLFSGYGYILLYIKKEKMCYLNSTVMVFMAISLNVILIPSYGVLGASWATAIALLVGKILEISEVYYFSKSIYL